MSIRTRLALTFIGLIVFGVTAIASYAILFIREFLTEEGKRQLLQEARYVEAVIEARPCADLPTITANLNRLPGYDAQLFDSGGIWLDSLSQAPKPWALAAGVLHPAGMRTEDGVVYVTRRMDTATAQCPPVAYLCIARKESDLYAPISHIRWIIYTGMFLSIGVVVVVSAWSARSIARPIQQLQQTAEAIAAGDTTRTLSLRRRDEVGQLAESLSRMAKQLQHDADTIRQQAERAQQFYADIAHEVRNPLHTALGTLELLQLPELPEQARARHLAVVQGQLKRLEMLFDDLMTLVRADGDPQFVQPQRTELGAILQRVYQGFWPQAAAKGLDFVCQQTHQVVWADPARLEQILVNLVSNAIKYTDKGRVEVGYAPADQGVRIIVSDTGPGIPAEHLPKLTERFYRADESRSRTAGGTGLGLAVVRHLVEAHGGTITLTSEVGRGTTAAIWLPAGPQYA